MIGSIIHARIWSLGRSELLTCSQQDVTERRRGEPRLIYEADVRLWLVNKVDIRHTAATFLPNRLRLV